MTTCVLWLTLTCFVVGVVTSEFGGPHEESENTVNDFLRALVTNEKTEEKRQWSGSNWNTGRCNKQRLRDINYDKDATLSSVLPIRPDCGERQDTDGMKRSLVQEFLQLVLDLDDDLDLEAGLDLDKKVVGGVISEHGEWPWQAAIGKKSTGQFCGGSLIADRWVLSAAHCFEEEDWNGNYHIPKYIKPCQYNVRLGEHSLTGSVEDHVDITPIKIFVHPDYDSDTIRNDIALIKLKKKAPIDAHNQINVVCLPRKNDYWKVGSTCMVSGWGDTTGNQDYADVVHHVNLKVISKRKCSKLTPYKGYIKPGMMCAGNVGGGPSSCQGDSGGPLVCKKRGSYVQAGIVSFGGNICGGKNQPGVYSNVKSFLHWIESVVSRKGL